jgi:methionyl-tRNA formyltransferase
MNLNQKLSIAFWGTPGLTITILDELETAGFTPSVIITGPDRPQGRGLVMTPPEPKLWAEKRNIPVLQPEKITPEFIEELRKQAIDLSVVVAYGKILPEAAITLPKHGTLNVHYSLLPRWRGATPVESAILAGDTETGVCIQHMVYTLDAGDIHNQERVTIGEHETAPALRQRLNILGAKLLVQTITAIENGSVSLTQQDESSVIKCGKITKEDGLIDPSGNPIENDRKFRAYYGWPGVYFFTEKDGKKIRIKVTDALLANGTWKILKVIPEGKKEIDYTQFLKN